MGGISSGRKGSGPGVSAYWAKMTPEERSAEMKRRMLNRRKKRRREQASTESPFPPDTQVTQVYLKPKRNLKGLISDLEAITSELKVMFGD